MGLGKATIKNIYFETVFGWAGEVSTGGCLLGTGD